MRTSFVFIGLLASVWAVSPNQDAKKQQDLKTDQRPIAQQEDHGQSPPTLVVRSASSDQLCHLIASGPVRASTTVVQGQTVCAQYSQQMAGQLGVKINTNGDIDLLGPDGEMVAKFMESELGGYESILPADSDWHLTLHTRGVADAGEGDASQIASTMDW